MSAKTDLDHRDGLNALPDQRQRIGMHSLTVGPVREQKGIQSKPMRLCRQALDP
jgi:hypothetical protein